MRALMLLDAQPGEALWADQVTFRRQPWSFGPVAVSIQASAYTYCRPRLGGEIILEAEPVRTRALPPLSFYSHVEVGLVHDEIGLVLPSHLGLPEMWDELFGNEPRSPVAGFVPLKEAFVLRDLVKIYVSQPDWQVRNPFPELSLQERQNLQRAMLAKALRDVRGIR